MSELLGGTVLITPIIRRPIVPPRQLPQVLDGFLLLNLSMPQNFNVESRGLTTTQLRWTNASTHTTNSIEIERALGQGAFSLIKTLGETQISFHDTGLVTGTLYRYRIRTVDGTRFSPWTAIKTVVTQSCAVATSFFGELTLPRLDEGNPSQIMSVLNEMMQMIEDRFNLHQEDAPMGVCVEDGAIIIDCSHGSNFEVEFSEDINSISFVNCKGPGTDIEVTFRPVGNDPTTGITPTVSGNNDEIVCCNCGTAGAPLTLKMGSGKKFVFKVNQHGVPVEVTDGDCGEGPGGGPAGSGTLEGSCECEVPDPDLNELTVKVCEELDCENTASELKLRVCGGTPHYTWTNTTEGGTVILSGDFDSAINIKRPDTVNNFGSTPAAAISAKIFSVDGAGCVSGLVGVRQFDCLGVFISPCQGISGLTGCSPGAGTPGGCCNTTNPARLFACCGAVKCSCTPSCGATCDELAGGTVTGSVSHDCRTQAMKDDGCNPCSATMIGKTVTVTDADGVQVVTII